jgi:hypothetical protein
MPFGNQKVASDMCYSPGIPGLLIKLTTASSGVQWDDQLVAFRRVMRREAGTGTSWTAPGADVDGSPTKLAADAIKATFPLLQGAWRQRGDSFFEKLHIQGVNPVLQNFDEIDLFQAKSVVINMDVPQLTEADNLNGVSWRGTLEYRAATYRTQLNGTWGDWTACTDGDGLAKVRTGTLMRCDMENRNGTWRLGHFTFCRPDGAGGPTLMSGGSRRVPLSIDEIEIALNPRLAYDRTFVGSYAQSYMSGLATGNVDQCVRDSSSRLTKDQIQVFSRRMQEWGALNQTTVLDVSFNNDNGGFSAIVSGACKFAGGTHTFAMTIIKDSGALEADTFQWPQLALE